MRKIIVPPVEAKEQLQGLVSLSISYINRTAEVGYGYGEEVDGRFIPIPSTVVYEQISYDELMEGQPEWSPGKPAGNFRIDDVFAVLDRKKERERTVKPDRVHKVRKGKEN